MKLLQRTKTPDAFNPLAATKKYRVSFKQRHKTYRLFSNEVRKGFVFAVSRIPQHRNHRGKNYNR